MLISEVMENLGRAIDEYGDLDVMIDINADLGLIDLAGIWIELLEGGQHTLLLATYELETRPILRLVDKEV